MPPTPAAKVLFATNLLIAVLLPVAWFAPLMTVNVSLRFWADGVALSVISTLASLWAEDPAMALLVTFLAIVAPVVKVLGTGLILAGLLSPRVHGALFHIGRLAMADVFLIAVYVAIFKGLDAGTIVPGWGLWLFTGCVLGSIAVSLLTTRLPARG